MVSDGREYFNKWYKMSEVPRIQRQLDRTVPTGTRYYWLDSNGNEVAGTFEYPKRKKPTKEEPQE